MVGFFIIISIAQKLHCYYTNLRQSKERISSILSLKVNLELNLFLILRITFKLTQRRMSQIVFSKVDIAQSDKWGKRP